MTKDKCAPSRCVCAPSMCTLKEKAQNSQQKYVDWADGSVPSSNELQTSCHIHSSFRTASSEPLFVASCVPDLGLDFLGQWQSHVWRTDVDFSCADDRCSQTKSMFEMRLHGQGQPGR